jgi:hypothetical protein
MNRKKTQDTATNAKYSLESTWQDEHEEIEKNLHIGMKEFDEWIDDEQFSAQMIDREMKRLSTNFRNRKFIETCSFLCVSICVVVLLIVMCVQMVGMFIALQVICISCIPFLANKTQQAVKT